MAKGFKDSEGRFHPTGNYTKRSPTHKSDQNRMFRGAGTAQIFKMAISDFAQKRKEEFAKQKEVERQRLRNELDHRRRFESGIIRAYILAKQQHITDPKQLKKFIYSRNPDLEDDKDTLQFVQSIVNDFKKQSASFEASITGKGEKEQNRLRAEFDNSIRDTEVFHDALEKDLKQKLDKDLQKELDKSNELLKKEKEKREKVEEALKEKDKKENELKNAQQENKSPEEIKKKIEQVQQAEKKVETAQSEEAKIEKDILEELKDIEQESKEPLEFGFPEGII